MSDDEWVDLGEWEFVEDTKTGEMGVRNARTGEVFLQSEMDELLDQLSDDETVLLGDPIDSSEWALFTPDSVDVEE